MARTTDWGLTDAGFRRPTYAELLDALEYKAREAVRLQSQPDRALSAGYLPADLRFDGSTSYSPPSKMSTTAGS